MTPRELKNLLPGISEAALVVDEWGRICGSNEAAERLLGYSASELVETNCWDLLQGRGSPSRAVCGERCGVVQCALASGRVSSYEMEIRLKTGGWSWVDVCILVWRDPTTRKPYIVHLLRDITRRKQTETLSGQLVQAAMQLLIQPRDELALPPAAPLTHQERKILQLLAAGKAPPVIARELAISARTLRNHLHNVNRKLHTHNRLEALMHVTHGGLI